MSRFSPIFQELIETSAADIFLENPGYVLRKVYPDMDVSKNRDTPKSSILIWFSIISHPFWGTPIFGNTHIPIFLF